MTVIVDQLEVTVEDPPATQDRPAGEGQPAENPRPTVLDRLHEAYALADRKERLTVE